jgi:hypothetical protein
MDSQALLPMNYQRSNPYFDRNRMVSNGQHDINLSIYLLSNSEKLAA